MVAVPHTPGRGTVETKNIKFSLDKTNIMIMRQNYVIFLIILLIASMFSNVLYSYNINNMNVTQNTFTFPVFGCCVALRMSSAQGFPLAFVSFWLCGL